MTRGHHARIPIDDVPDFLKRLKTREGAAARCLVFLILTAARSNEALGARWIEINWSDRTWTVPTERMKANKEHRVPLSLAALDVLGAMKGLDQTHVFAGQRRNQPLSSAALEMVLRRMGVTDGTVHGFRSCFRDWAGNRTGFPRELAEHALAHAIGDKAEQAYRRDDALERRRPLMEAWAEFCCAGRRDRKLDRQA